MFQLGVQIDETAIAQLKGVLGDFEKRSGNVLAGAINETLAEKKTQLSKLVREVLNLSKKSTDSRIKLVKATMANLYGEVRLNYEKRPGLFSFDAREVKAGVSYKLTKTGGRKTVPSAFIAAKRGQTHLNVFVRKRIGGVMWDREIARQRRAAGKTSWPLLRLMGLSPWGSVTYRAGVLEQWMGDVDAILQKNLQQRVDALVGGHMKYGESGESRVRAVNQYSGPGVLEAA